MAAVGVAGSLGGAALSSHAAGHAADEQSQAAISAAQLQKQSADEALAFQKQQYNTSQSQMQPWLQSGTAGLANLDYLLGITPSDMNGTPGQALPTFGQMSPVGTPKTPIFPGQNSDLPQHPGVPNALAARAANGTVAPNGAVPRTNPNGPNLAPLVNTSLGAKGSLMTPFGEQFVAPTNVTEQNDPGYQFRMNQGMKALQNSAAAKGTLLNGGTGKDITDYAQNDASNEYANVYGRTFNEFANRYNIYNQDQTSKYNRLASLAGVGQQTANQLATLGQNNANNASQILLQSGNAQASGLNNAAAARASGIVSSGNAYGSALGGASNDIMTALLYKNLYGGGGGGGVTPALANSYGVT